MKAFSVTNKHPKWTLHTLLEDLILFLKKEFSAEIYTQEGGTKLIESLGHSIGDCEVVIYDESSDTLKAISYGEHNNGLLQVFENRNSKNDILVLAHLREWGILDLEKYKKKYKYNLTNTNFLTYSPFMDYGEIYNIRKNIKFDNMIDQAFFRCTTGRGDEFELERLGLTNARFSGEALDKYLKRAITYKLGLSISGCSEICHRDIEYMAIGLPLMRFEFLNQYNPHLIPNHHYISISREGLPKDSKKDQAGGKDYIIRYQDRYNEVKNDQELLDHVSLSARTYYEENCTKENRLKKIISHLNL